MTKKGGKRSRRARRGKRQETVSNSLLDQKTFLFNEFVPVYSATFVPNLEPIDV
jgi:hypothetical protein